MERLIISVKIMEWRSIAIMPARRNRLLNSIAKLDKIDDMKKLQNHIWKQNGESNKTWCRPNCLWLKRTQSEGDIQHETKLRRQKLLAAALRATKTLFSAHFLNITIYTILVPSFIAWRYLLTWKPVFSLPIQTDWSKEKFHAQLRHNEKW